MKLDFEKLNEKISNADCKRTLGRITKIVGLMLEAQGLHVELGELCLIRSNNATIEAEVVGFKDDQALLMPLAEIHEIKMGAEVTPTKEQVHVRVGPNLVGRIINALGVPLDEGFELRLHHQVNQWQKTINPLKKSRITDKIHFGVKALDGMLSCGKGQRLGIFAGSGVGKSTLMGMLARNSSADINVIALVGERGREVREFIEECLGEEGLKKSIVIVATGNEPSLVRIKAAIFAHSIAEYFRDVMGKDVLLMLDSVTRVALAQREIGLAVGEPPATRGFTPSVFALLPKLLERSGTSDKGSITALYTVLVEGDDMNEPVSDLVRGVLDGHIVLSRDLAHKNHYPAIDILQSVSRVMPSIVDKEHMQAAGQIRSFMATYKDAQDLINIGAYQKGSNPDIDKAIKAYPKINSLLRQATEEDVSEEETLRLMKAALS
ncbi:MAG: flagellar protein export ATPase FliI [Candidatus Caenarcaniphilales bacterium]|jgi:flagellum-specific ATP synthase|nr:flagellar protein export ATPase FliI [Candidatus Caenarcaniphilales bacterium]